MQSISNNHNLPCEKQIQEIMDHAHSVCVFGSTNKPKEKIDKNTLSNIAMMLHKENDLKNPFIAKITDSGKFKCKKYQDFFDKKLSPVTFNDRRDFLEGMLIITKISSYSFAFGNCEPMTDVAFLEAATKDFSCGIHYIRFDNKFNPQVEEINTLVLGDWPKKGCLIVSAWEGDFGKVYTWQGSLKETLKLRQRNYNNVRSLFSIEKEDKFGEKNFIKSISKSLDKANWLKVEYRLSNMRSIRETFLSMVCGTKIFSKEKNLNYIDVVMHGRTSTKNYENLKATQALLFNEIKCF